MGNLFALALFNSFVFLLSAYYFYRARQIVVNPDNQNSETGLNHRAYNGRGFVTMVTGVILLLVEIEAFGVRFDTLPSWLRHTHEGIAGVAFACMVAIFCLRGTRLRSVRRFLMPVAYYLYVWVTVPLGMCIMWFHVIWVFLRGGA